MPKPKTPWDKFITWITRPIWLPWIPEDMYRRNLQEWKESHGLIEKPKVTINITKNIYGAKVKNKKTGEILELNEDDYEMVKNE